MRVQRTIISFCLFIITVNILLYKYNYQFEYYHKNPENLGNGTLLTRQSVSYNAALLFPINKRDVRIEAQLKYVLPTEKTRKNDKWKKTKQSQSDADGKLKPLRQQYKKLLIDNLSWLKPLKKNQGSFLEYKCPVNTCLVTYNKSEEKSVDAIFFIERVRLSRKLVHRNQIWMFMTHECPVFSPPIKHLSNSINWTITYRPDSTIAYPYSRFRYFNSLITQKEQVRNYAMGKPKKVAWFVSNCYPNNNRTDYAKELAKYIQVDIYGGCGTKVCKRKNEEQCFRKLEEEYKFYLAFENSNCRDYITEKFFRNALQHDILPIVMGAHPDDYREIAPKNSYIHYEDFKSAKELADYLHKLDKNDDLYNEYFKWKGTGEFIDLKLWCRICAMLHAADHEKPTWYENIWEWWAGKGQCIGKQRWT